MVGSESMKKRLLVYTILAAGLIDVVVTVAAQQFQSTNTAQPKPQSQPYVAVASGVVDVTDGVVRVYSLEDGLVTLVRVNEGDRVKRGQRMLVLDKTDVQIRVAIAEGEVAKAVAGKKGLESKLEYAKRRLKTLRLAAKAGASTDASAGETAAQVDQLRSELDVAKADMEIARQRLKRARLALGRCDVHAPVAGKIIKRDVRVGDYLTGSGRQELFEILPEQPLIVRAEVNEDFVDKINPGQEAEILRDDNTVLFRSRVIRVGDVFTNSRLHDQAVQQGYTHSVECILTGPKEGARVGQLVRVRFLPQKKTKGSSPDRVGKLHRLTPSG